MNTEKLEHAIERIQESPLFYLFSSSKELFHSNFWFWLSRLNESQTYGLFTNKKQPSKLVFKREHNQSEPAENGERIKAKIDLMAYQSEISLATDNQTQSENLVPFFAIENKVKDFPTQAQLNRIRESFGKNNQDIEFILTTLFWKEELKSQIAADWTVMTYRDIASRIIPENFTSNSYYKSLISDYKDFMLNLSELNELIEISNEYNFFSSVSENLFKQLNKINLWEGYLKLRASHLMIKFNQEFNLKNVKTYYGINNQKATLDFRPIDKIQGYQFGIQIEGSQYRKFIEGENAGAIADKFIQNNIFLNPEFKEYKGSRYRNYGAQFKYQYEAIAENLPFTDLFNRINNDLNFIQNHHTEIEKIINYN